MVLELESPPSAPSSEIIGTAFVEQYYHVLHTKPEMAHLFYKESSNVSRQDLDGVMTSVTTLEGIEEIICSLNFNDYKAKIVSADSQNSHNGGVMVVVIGSLSDKDNMKRMFTQSFFLAPQEAGFFVSNDIFRYLENTEIEPSQSNPGDELNDVPVAPLTPGQETPRLADHFTLESATSPAVDDQMAVESEGTLVNESQLINEEVEVVESKSHSSETHSSSPIPESSCVVLEDAPKKSYASIVSSKTKKTISEVMKVNDGNSKISVPLEPTKSEKTSSVSVGTPTVPETPNETINLPDEVEGYSIYVRNLPFNLAVSELEEVFSEFGLIREGGVQVISQMHLGKCFGFVEFLSENSMEDAIKASALSIGGRKLYVDIKKTTARAPVDGIGRVQYGRGGFANNNNFRNRRYFDDDYQDYGRNDYNNGGGYAGRGRGQRTRNEEGFQRERGQRMRNEEGFQRGRGRTTGPFLSNRNHN